jgi:ketosteroid isomerase-like protein
MKKLILGFMLSSMSFLPSFTYGQANTNQQITDEIIGMVKAQWAAEVADPANFTEQFKNYADDYTEFNGDYSTRLEGKAQAMRLTEPYGKDPNRTAVGEMLNPKVQIYGDVAILTYNYAGLSKNKDAEVKAIRAKSTRVYAKIGGKWKMVHANFAPDPLPKN